MPFYSSTTENNQSLADIPAKGQQQRNRLSIISLFRDRILSPNTRNQLEGITSDSSVGLLEEIQRHSTSSPASEFVVLERRSSGSREQLQRWEVESTGNRSDSNSEVSQLTDRDLDCEASTWVVSTNSSFQRLPPAAYAGVNNGCNSSRTSTPTELLFPRPFTPWIPSEYPRPYQSEISLSDVINIYHDNSRSRHLIETSIPLGWFRGPLQQFATKFLLTRDFKEVVKKEQWIMNDNWLKVSSPSTALSKVEDAFSANSQAGLIETDIALRHAPIVSIEAQTEDFAPQASRKSQKMSLDKSHPASSIAETVNLHLIRSCAFLACDDLERSLESADKGFSIARGELIYYMMSKSQLYRGLCLMKMMRWKEASEAFTRAANIRGWAGKVASLKALAERNLLEDMKNKRRVL